MRKLISHVFKQDMITWKHAANEKQKLVPHSTKHNMIIQPDKTGTACNTTHVDRKARGRANSRLHAHKTRQNMEHECPNPDTKRKLKTWVPGSKHYAPTRNKACRRDCARLEHARSRMLTWKQDMTGVSGLCHKTMHNTRPKWQNPDNLTLTLAFLFFIFRKLSKVISFPVSHKYN